MRVACLSCFAPRRENVGGPTGLLYQLLKHRPSIADVTLFLLDGSAGAETTTASDLRDLLDAGLKLIRLPRGDPPGRSLRTFFWPLGALNAAGHRLPAFTGFDVVWVYPYWLAPFVRRAGKPVLVSGMDAATLLYFRRVKEAIIHRPNVALRSAAGLLGNMLFEALYLRGLRTHVVGEQDAAVLTCLGADAFYIRHPLLAYETVKKPARSDTVLRILVSNLGDPFYGSHLYERWMMLLRSVLPPDHAVELLLHKASDAAAQYIAHVFARVPNVSVVRVAWVEDYGRFLTNVDVQFFPLEVGAGTKTSVLTALQHQVVSVCTAVAAENVECASGLHVAGGGDAATAATFQAAMAEAAGARSGNGAANFSLASHDPVVCAGAFWQQIEGLLD